jgi:hypothetical protein
MPLYLTLFNFRIDGKIRILVEYDLDAIQKKEKPTGTVNIFVLNDIIQGVEIESNFDKEIPIVQTVMQSKVDEAIADALKTLKKEPLTVKF